MTAYQAVCKALGIKPGKGNQYAKCPAHEDGRASLSVAEGDEGRALLVCFAGCPTPDVVAALGLEMGDLFSDHRGDAVVGQYVYADEAGEPLIRVKRLWPKGFTQESWNARTETWRNSLGTTRRVPYNLAGLLAADHVWIVEGEKDAESLLRIGEQATTLLGGAGKWREEYAQYFQGKTVEFIADNDQPDKKGRQVGIEGVLKVKNALRGIAHGLDVWISPHAKDITDHLEQGFGLGDLERYTTATDELFEPLAWADYKVAEEDWLFEPYLPRQARVLAFGTAGSLKSLWAMWIAKMLAESGHRVAYFSLEMSAHETAKRMRKLNPPPERFKLYRKFSFTSPSILDAAIEVLKGFSLIVVDSWTAASTQMELRDSNQAVAKLDAEVFMPLMEETGATLLILDNTGHSVVTEKGMMKTEWARGASAKGDKMDLSMYFDRPSEEDNYTTRIKVKKMRGDIKIPVPITVTAGDGNIDFRVVGKKGEDLGSLWTYFGDVDPYEAPKVERPASVLDKLKEARAQTKLGANAGSQPER